ncbi:orotidine 5'-phosphate decarboxylase / HUMPS family protein [Clostridium felsineum]|uniref:3-hexulose-6-phosphate synthase n=1 Tax=Clostridium felsineum TaxID=36839 RepID=A0A1S8MCF1_9CLOT|nr:orotidine 5'-phosphate decarboxylase / HUMPS family protein [Clostridium felsineum]URZ04962.1 3-hexulose-6-phosphate synthase [Clostridium felsineum]URZ10003.1 3-hexulose-6-phosphate synthase [Clostridium felsineum]
MKIQLALDRMTLSEAKSIVEEVHDYIDIIEVGTSLIKDYGKKSIQFIRSEFKDKVILADIKTCDEGEYEFKAAYEAGADIATVMGNSPIETIKICYEVSKKYKKHIMIDLMETDDSKIETIKTYEDAILFVHLPKDSENKSLIDMFQSKKQLYKDINRLAVGGGINEKIIVDIEVINPEIVVVGSLITKSKNAAYTAKRICEKLQSGR